MVCPRCGQEAGAQAICPRCGVIFAKLGARGSAPRRSPPQAAANPPAQPTGSAPVKRPRSAASSDERSLASRLAAPLLVVGLAVAAFLGIAVVPTGLSGSLQRAKVAPAPVEPAVAAATEPPPPTLASLPPLELGEAPKPAGVTAADQARAEALTDALKSHSPLGAADVEAVLALVSRYPQEPGLRPLAEAVMMTVADTLKHARKLTEAADLLRRATIVKPDSRPARTALLSVLLDASDWTAAEAVARDLLSLAPRDANAWRGLGFSLMRQDRNREAAEALRTSLEIYDDTATRQMLAHVEKGMRDEKGMSEKQLAHFHVRYDGDAHEDVGREMLRALERHFATLAGVFDHQPAAPIPVILFSQQAYYDASGAPAWSGGVFNHLDGRIRIPIGGLTSSLTPDIDNVLAHEVTHAFIADISRGVCPRDVHEGMAQYMEGKRIASELKPNELRALADGRIAGVSAFYLGALAFVEHLMGQRGQGGMNDLLHAMGETGDVNAAFRQVYGQDHRAAAQAFSDRFRLQNGS